jgi:hypothetical protein
MKGGDTMAAQSSDRREDCRIHAFGYARRIVLSALTGILDSEGLYFDVIGLRQHLAESVRTPAANTPADARAVRLLSSSGPMEVVVSRFCAEVEGLCSPRDIPNPLTTGGLQTWAAATRQNICVWFAGWGLEILRQELDAVADKLTGGESA